MSRRRVFIKNGILLATVALLMRGVSLAFNSYITARIGAEGMGLLSLTMSVYGFAVTFATSGVSLAVTRLCAEALGRGETGDVRAIVRRATLYAVGFGGVASVVLFSFAGPIGLSWLGDARTVPSLRVLAFALVPIALATIERQKLDTDGQSWRSVLDATGQEFYFNGVPRNLFAGDAFAP